MNKIFWLFAVFFVLSLALVSKSTGAEIYQWKDEKGNIHMTDNLSAVPEKYRDQIQKKKLPEDLKAEGEQTKAKDQDKVKDPGRKEKKEKTPQKKSLNLNKIESDVMESFRTIVSLWKDKKYNLLYEWGDRKSRMAINKEDFERRMANKNLELASSWETLKDVNVEIKSPALAYVTAKIGYRSKKGGDTQFRTETYPMAFENGSWKINLQKILNVKM
jgi:hypothetical protein